MSNVGSSPIPAWLTQPEAATSVPTQAEFQAAEEAARARAAAAAPPPAEPPVPPMVQRPPPNVLMQQPPVTPARTIPAHLRPEKMETEVKEGVPVPEGAQVAIQSAMGHGIAAAQKEHAANEAYAAGVRDITAAHLQGTSDAIAQHQAVQAQRDQIVNAKLAQIEDLNRQAQVQPGDIWGDKQNQARVIGTLISVLLGVGVGIASGGGRQGGRLGIPAGLTAFGSGMKTVDAAIERDIEYKFKMAERAGANAKAAQGLLATQLDVLGDKDKAIDAQKLAYYDDIKQQIELLKAQHGAGISDAKMSAAMQDLENKYADTLNNLAKQEHGTITHSFTQKWEEASTVGGTPAGGFAPGIREDERVLTIPASDKTGERSVDVAVPKEVYAKLSGIQGATNELVALNNEALGERKKLRDVAKAVMEGKMSKSDAAVEAATIRRTLQKLQLKRVHVEQKADDEGVTRDADLKQAMKRGLDYSGGIGYGGNPIPEWVPLVGGQGPESALLANHDRAIQEDSQTLSNLASQKLRGATGWVVEPTIVVEPAHSGKGAPQVQRPGYRYNGERYTGQAVPPAGGRPQ